MSFFVCKSPDTQEKLRILSRDSRYDLACACATGKDEHRRRSADDRWIYPVTLPSGRTTYLFKTLLSNACINDCLYCPLRAGSDARRCALTPEELVRVFSSYYDAGRVSGLFLSSAACGKPDATMERINRSAFLLRRSGFRGYIHLKIIPGASEAAMRHSLSLASAVSLNIEAPNAKTFSDLSTTKNYESDILSPIRAISRLTARGGSYERVKHTTQFVVGASRETDAEIIGASWDLYRALKLDRVYFSAYQRGAGSEDLPGEHSSLSNADLLMREHRLYQADWLMRKYGFLGGEIPVDERGNLSLSLDPKEMWAGRNPGFFPVDINRDEREKLLRVPGLGQVAVDRILERRKGGSRIGSLDFLGKQNKRLKKAAVYLKF